MPAALACSTIQANASTSCPVASGPPSAVEQAGNWSFPRLSSSQAPGGTRRSWKTRHAEDAGRRGARREKEKASRGSARCSASSASLGCLLRVRVPGSASQVAQGENALPLPFMAWPMSACRDQTRWRAPAPEWLSPTWFIWCRLRIELLGGMLRFMANQVGRWQGLIWPARRGAGSVESSCHSHEPIHSPRIQIGRYQGACSKGPAVHLGLMPATLGGSQGTSPPCNE